MYVIAEPFWIQKSGCSEAEFEDAFCPRNIVDGADERRFAVADGATETSFSSVWAKQLARSYCQGDMDSLAQIKSRLPALQENWSRIVRRRPLPWYAEEKLRSGTYAALAGLTFSESSKDSGSWTAIACGDSCIAHVRGENLLMTFPITRSESFSNSPILLSTDLVMNVKAIENIQEASGEWQTGDSFYLMTDALASWFIQCCEMDQKPWAILRDLAATPLPSAVAPSGFSQLRPFRPWVEELRQSHAIRNDDVTLFRIEIQ